MTQITNSSENSPRRRLLPVVLALLFIFVAISSCIVGYILGQRAVPLGGGQIIDTIILSPTDSRPQVPLSLSGIVHYTDGTPYANGEVELHSNPRLTQTDQKGSFFFHAVEAGEHLVRVVDENGNELAQVKVNIVRESNFAAQMEQGSDGIYQLQVPLEALLVELEIELDRQTGAMVVKPGQLTTVFTGGRISTPEGFTTIPAGKVILTPNGVSVLPDGTISLPHDGVILNDGTYVSLDGTVSCLDGTVISPDGVVTLPNGSTAALGQIENLPGGISITEDGGLSLPDGTVVGGDRTVTLPGGTVIAPNKVVTATDGTVVNIVEGTAQLPNGIKIDHGTATLPDGTVVNPEKQTIMVGDGTVISYEGNITRPDGTSVATDTPGTLPDGTIVSEDGTVGLPDGTTVTPDGTVTTPGGTEVTPPQEGEGYEVGKDTSQPIETTSPPAPSPTPTPEPSPEPTPTPTPAPAPSPSPAPDNGGEKGGGGGGGQPPSGFAVTENGVNWTQLTTINLFALSDSEVPGKLYPGVTGSYSFNVQNNQSFGVRFYLTISEAEHPAGAIPFEFRLRDKVGYVAGTADNWLPAAEMGETLVTLTSVSSVQYTLEWRWPYESGNDELDTALGTHADSGHIIKVTIYAEQIT